MGLWTKVKDWLNMLLTGEPENQSRDIVPYQTAHRIEDRLPVRGSKQDINTVDSTTDMFKDAPPELIQCILEGGIINVRGKSFEEVKALLKRDTSIQGATFTITDERGEERGKVIIWRNKQTGELEFSRKPQREQEQQKRISQNNIRQIGR